MRLWFVTHPEVDIRPEVPVPDWSLSARGRARVAALAARGWPGPGARLVSSPEAKARETAALLAAGRPVTLLPALAEIDRSATGYVPHDRHQALALRLFARPAHSADGWERAVDAQQRMTTALTGLLAGLSDDPAAGDLVLIGHGGTGTLLRLALARLPIAPGHDQPGQGHGWWAPLHPRPTGGWAAGPPSDWIALEALDRGPDLPLGSGPDRRQTR